METKEKLLNRAARRRLDREKMEKATQEHMMAKMGENYKPPTYLPYYRNRTGRRLFMKEQSKKIIEKVKDRIKNDKSNKDDSNKEDSKIN